jgi:HrpA-like RNA helicase
MTESKWGISNSELTKIINFIAKPENFVCGIVSPAGSGKSTALIQKMMEQNSRVFVSEPTIPAAEGLYRYMGPKIGVENVGFAAEGNINYTSQTKVVYCTSGHLRRKFLSYFENGKVKNGNIDFCDVLVLDEIHNGSLDYDVIMELWNLAYSQGAMIPRLVLASATMSMDPMYPSTIFETLPIYEVKVKGFPIEEEYAKQDYDVNAKSILTDIAMNVIRKHTELPVNSNKTSKWLVFCPGTNEVETVIKILKSAELEKVDILPAYSMLQRDQMDKIFNVPELGTRTIIVATNIAEASITIDGLDGVFDTLLEKVLETSQSGGTRLALQNISKSSANQRKGRTGRTNPGFCFRLCTESGFEKLKEQREREIFRVPLTNVLIEMMDVGIDPVQVFMGRTLEKKMKETFKILKDIGMIEIFGGNKIVTEKGHFAPYFPLSVYNSSLIWEWTQLTKENGTKYPIFPIVALASLIDCFGPSYFFYPKKEYYHSEAEHREVLNNYYKKHFKIFAGESDLEVLLTLWNTVCGHFETVIPTKSDISKWSQAHSMNNKKIMEVFNVVKQCCLVLTRLGYDVDLGIFSEKNVIKVATPILEKVYSKNVFVYQAKTRSYYNPETKEYYKINMKAPLVPDVQQFPNKIVALSLSELPNKSGGPPTRLISLYQSLD